ncbi:MAG TPA: enoyl-CoA hydratase [Stellaceae bacterium]|nr:enoyl-CoA hydratase [Stellaceae bacterium]
MAEPVLSEVKDGIGTIIFNRPEALNALSTDMTEGLIEATGRFERDPAVRCVVLRGAGEHFMAGGDIKGFHKSLTEDRAGHVARLEMRVVKAHQTIYHLRRMAKPVLVSVQGAAAGFGLSMILAADLAIASDDAYFTLAYRHIGLSADGGATYFLPRIVGERRALEIALLGERFTAARAHEIGILNWVVPRATLAEQTMAIARRLADGPTMALGRAKQLIRMSLDNSWDEQSHREAEGLAAAAATDDHLEGVAAFIEKRKPAFKGR